MSIIPDDVIEQVRDGADIVAIVGESVDLKRTGSDYRGPCPFHGGTHRNFAVIPKKGLYYCYVCHAAGDVFSYLMKRFGVDYPTAVREVARRSGIVIPERGQAGPDPREPLFGAVAAAQDWFARQLLESPEAAVAREYLAGREVELEQAAQLGLGFAPPGSGFLSAMAGLGIAEGLLLESGLAARRDDGTVVPRFRGRLLFPIHDLRGRVVGFGGRLLGPGEPKYLNSPDSEIFHKGRLLYNLHQAKAAIRQEEAVILVEGYFDVLRLVLAGIEHVVAPLGTALTPDQAALLRRFTGTAILLYDSDRAGLRATFRAADELLAHGMRVRVATLPAEEDPDTLVRRGGREALAAITADALDVLERKIQLLERRGWFEGVEHRREALDRLLPTIRAARDAVTRELYTTRVAERLGVPREIIAAEARPRPAPAPEFRGAGPSDARPPAAAARRTAVPFGRRKERQLLAAMVAAPDWRERARREVRPELLEVPEHRELFERLVALPADAPADRMPEGLSPEAAQAWSELRQRASAPDAPRWDDEYANAWQILQARADYRAVEQVTDPGERRRRRAELDRRYPAYAAMRHYVRRAQQARRQAGL